jgi:hypothetical protein
MKTNKRAVYAATVLALAITVAGCATEGEAGITIERAEIVKNDQIAVFISHDDKELEKTPSLLTGNTVLVVNGSDSGYSFIHENIDLLWFEYDIFSGKTLRKRTGFLNRRLHKGDTVVIRGVSKLLGEYTLTCY